MNKMIKNTVYSADGQFIREEYIPDNPPPTR